MNSGQNLPVLFLWPKFRNDDADTNSSSEFKQNLLPASATVFPHVDVSSIGTGRQSILVITKIHTCDVLIGAESWRTRKNEIVIGLEVPYSNIGFSLRKNNWVEDGIIFL